MANTLVALGSIAAAWQAVLGTVVSGLGSLFASESVRTVAIALFRLTLWVIEVVAAWFLQWLQANPENQAVQ